MKLVGQWGSKWIVDNDENNYHYPFIITFKFLPKEVAKDFAKSDGVIFKIHSLNGKSISALSAWNVFEDEDEVLFAASSVFLVKSIEYNRIGKIRQIELQNTRNIQG